ncbi:MAG: DUF2752 domain-containing protein [Bacteroidales bacterium]|jgi:hypothetical protein
MLETFILWLEAHLQPCFYKSNFGIDCPGCGMQRALIELLKGHVWESLKLYPALLPVLFMIVFLGLHLVFKFKHGAALLKYLFIGNTILIIGNYLGKLFI